MRRVYGLLIALAVIIWIRSELIENIHPWQWQWALWVGGTCAISWCGGYAHALAIRQRRAKKK